MGTHSLVQRQHYAGLVHPTPCGDVIKCNVRTACAERHRTGSYAEEVGQC